MKIVKACAVVLCVFAPFLMVGYAIVLLPNSLEVVQRFDGIDWMWLIFLGLMMVALYYFLAVHLKEENEIELDFAELDADHDGYIGRDDASGWARLAQAFDRFDVDRDGRLSRAEFERFEHSLAR